MRAAIKMERVMGIEPTLSAWEAEVLPLNYTRRLMRSLPVVVREKRPIRIFVIARKTHRLFQKKGKSFLCFSKQSRADSRLLRKMCEPFCFFSKSQDAFFSQ